MLFTAGVQEQGHPVVSCRFSNVVNRVNIEIEVVKISCDLHVLNVIASGGVLVLKLTKPLRIAVCRIAYIVLIICGNFGAVPLVKAAVHINGLVFSNINLWIRALILTDIIHHLHIVVIAISALHRLCVTAIVLVCTVHKENRFILQSRRLTLCHPFVPAGDKNHLRILGNGILPLLREVIAHIDGTVRNVVGAVMPASGTVVGTVPSCRAEACGGAVLRNGHVHDFTSAIQSVNRAIRQRAAEFHPRETVILSGFIRPLVSLDAEEFFDGLVCVGFIPDNQRLTVPIKPKLFILRMCLINFIINAFHGVAGGGIGIKYNLRHIPTLLLVFI